jgi:phosphoribosylglycinamide formyltransferase-1
MKNIAVLVSGGGTNLQALIDAQNAGQFPNAGISLVISSKPGVYALKRAHNNNIATAVVDWSAFRPDRPAFSAEILRLLRESRIDLVVYAGFMVILDECVVEAFPNRMLNVHPSLIPSFSGKGMYGIKVHEAALERGVKLTGATVHFVNEVCDGGPIILQKAIEVYPGDTPESLQKRVMVIEQEILPQAVKLLTDIKE